jgi:hypothetical protein
MNPSPYIAPRAQRSKERKEEIEEKIPFLSSLRSLLLCGLGANIWLAAAIAVTLSGGCQSTTPPPVAPPPPTAKTQTFEDKPDGIRFQYPDGWKPVTGGTALFKVSNPDPAKGYAVLSLDVPKLPWHVPGMIPIDPVANGYIDDVKKRLGGEGAKVEQDIAVSIPSAQAKRVKITGVDNGKPSIDEAVTIVHGDKVYILSCDSDDQGYATAKAALDMAVGSIQWIK